MPDGRRPDVLGATGAPGRASAGHGGGAEPRRPGALGAVSGHLVVTKKVTKCTDNYWGNLFQQLHSEVGPRVNRSFLILASLR